MIDNNKCNNNSNSDHKTSFSETGQFMKEAIKPIL